MNTNDTNTEAPETETAAESVAPVAAETEAAVEAPVETESEAAGDTETAVENPDTKEISDTQKKPRFAFWKKLVIYCAVWLVLIVSACSVMWNVMVQYETAQPWYAVEAYLQTAAQSAFHTALRSAYPDTGNPYESIEAIADELSEKYGKDLTYTKLIREYTYETPVYLLQSGDTKLLKLTLAQGEETGFLGLRGYRVETVELVASELFDLRSYGLVFPTGAEVHINGKALTEDTLAAESAFTVFGDGFTACMLENFFERPAVKVVYDGTELREGGSGDFLFDYPESRLRTLTVTAPAEAVVRIDGKRVSDHFLSETVTSAPDPFGATVELCTYTVPTVSGEGTVTAALDGVTLQAEQTDSIWAVQPITESCTVVVPKDAVLYVNGNAVDKSFITAEDTVWVSAFDGVRNYPSAVTYTLSALYTLPELTAALGNASLVKTADGEHTVFVQTADETLKETYTKQAIDFMNAYLYYTTQGYSNTRANLDAVKAHVANPSPLYTNLERSYIGYYYIAPQRMTVEYMEADNFIPFGEDAFTCELSYKINLKNWVGETTEENTMRIAFVRSGKNFAPVNMLLAEE